MRGGRWAVASMLAVAVAAGAAANAIEREDLASGWHTVVRGEVGTDTTAGNLQVHVHGTTTATDLQDGDAVVPSPAAFVVVELSYATTDVWDTPEEVVLVSGDGREFTQPAGFPSDGRAWETGPDIWHRGTLLFEVPEDVTDDLALEVRPERPDARLPAAVLRVPLAVTTSPEPVALKQVTVLAEGER